MLFILSKVFLQLVHVKVKAFSRYHHSTQFNTSTSISEKSLESLRIMKAAIKNKNKTLPDVKGKATKNHFVLYIETIFN